MPQDNEYILKIELLGWDAKQATFRATEDEAKGLANILTSVFRDGVLGQVIRVWQDES